MKIPTPHGLAGPFPTRAPARDAATTATGGRMSREPLDPPSDRAMNVLIVDDQRDEAEGMAALLELRGHRAVCSDDPRRALALLRDFDPDVAVLDIGLPHMDGYELAMHLRVNGARCRLVVVTGRTERDARRCTLAGVERFLSKPVDAQALFAAVEGVPG